MTNKTKLMKLENRYRFLESRGDSVASNGVMRKIVRQIRNIKSNIDQ